MNVYDFDKTIYSGDSTIDFWKHCTYKYPKILIRFPKVLWAWMKNKIGLSSKEDFKQEFYGFLRHVPNVQFEVNLFLDDAYSRIKPWYLAQKEETDLIISASPTFLLKPICAKLGVSLIASNVDEKTGEVFGENCKGAEKVVRFQTEFFDQSIECFYSDSKTDTPLALLAERAYIVKNDIIVEWRL